MLKMTEGLDGLFIRGHPCNPRENLCVLCVKTCLRLHSQNAVETAKSAGTFRVAYGLSPPPPRRVGGGSEE
ncbi:hypothetical protein SAMN05444173_2522 [Opitutus sp. GAS368]|nr:hypothetical protein SAMN05444173_2522 [Opitutus sp. GAS368]